MKYKDMKKILYAPMKLIPSHWKNRDKWGHALVGTVIYIVLLPFLDPAAAFMAVLLVAVAKEVWDYIGYGVPSLGDLLATVAVPYFIYAILILL